MGINGYSDKLIAIDDEMAALGRPLAPVVSWISGGLKGDLNARTATWREQLQAWEQTNLDAAVRWLELREQYRAQDEIEERAKWSEDEWHYRLLGRLGAPQLSLDIIRTKFSDTPSMRCANEWLCDGTTWCLVLIGGIGCGKTTAATWVAHQMAMRRFRPFWVDCPTQVDRPMFGAEAELTKFRAREAGVLVLDDLASSARERDTARPPTHWLDWLDGVLARRHGEKRKTIITSNRPWDDWLKRWLGARLADRLGEGLIHSTNEPSMRETMRRGGA